MSNCNCNAGQPSDNGGIATVTPGGLEIPFDRVTYRDGQLLTASDLAADLGRNRRLRQLHTHYLHNTWGIAIGYSVRGKDGDNAVQVGPGYAVDQQGRELVLVNTAAVPVPFSSQPELRVLCMRYQEDAAFQKLRNSGTACPSGNSDALTESPVFAWRLPDEFILGRDVPLITGQVNNGAIVGSLDLRVRRYAQKLVRPYIASGATDPGRTGWTMVTTRGRLSIFKATIVTTDAGFNSTPFYFPVLHMPNGVIAAFYGISNGQTNKDFADFSGPYSFLDNESQTGFDFSVVVPLAASTDGPEVRPEKAGWTVSWLGVEPVGGCIPEFRLIEIFFRFPLLLQQLRFLVKV
jgi:hypothetical protein